MMDWCIQKCDKKSWKYDQGLKYYDLDYTIGLLSELDGDAVQ